MIAAIREWLAERAGRSQAAHEIKLLSIGYFTKEQAAEQQNERLKDKAYDRGHGQRWYEHKQGFRHETLDAEYERLVRLLISADLWPSFGIRT
ncbi:hypothetical protein IB277_14745 [Ensifer sp. ENS07]|uniref:hypothetical protein n=1 Tax=Ensifer sp. ENS07 TaxID=2769274 RepID=UPI00177C5FAF|nr:hypothetical protein [Ensifer sp. ENS07]MBD9637562.1 hypothetical protein [Ensifer sp. ENS07]